MPLSPSQLRKLIDPALKKALLEGPEIIPEAVQEASSDLSIDSMMQRGLAAIDRLMRCITMDISTGAPSRETVMNLKDCLSMLKDLKEREEGILESMSEEDLRRVGEVD